MNKKILIATEKPFSKEAIDTIQKRANEAEGFDLQLLEEYTDQAEFLRAASDANALIVRSDQVTESVIEAARELKVIVRAGSGYDNIDLDSASGRSIVVMNTPGQNANAVAELTFGLMLSLIRNKYNGTAGTELRGKRIGMHGFGNIGKCIASIAKGFNMEIIAYDPYLDGEVMKIHGAQVCGTLEELYQSCDLISMNIPANERTVQSINYDLLSLTRQHAMLVNTARKELIDEKALLRIMDERPNLMYASDVAPTCKAEMEERYPTRTMFTTKKMGAQTNEANVNAGVAAINQIIDFFNTGNRTFQVN